MNFKVTKHEAQFKDVPANTYFYTDRHPNHKINSSDSITLYKEKADDKTASSFEWGTTVEVPEQLCWWFTDNEDS